MRAGLAARVVRKARVGMHMFIENINRFASERSRQANNEVAEELIQNGFVKFTSEKTAGLSDYLVPVVENYIASGVCPEDVRMKTMVSTEYGVRSLCVDLNSPFIFKYILNKELYDILYSYFGRPFYLRNNVVITINYPGEVNDAQVMHCDWGLRQLTLMVNLVDLDESSVHMEYLAGSHRRYYFSHPNGETDKFQQEVAGYLKENPDSVLTTCGKKDTLSLFNAGTGYHQQVRGSGKRIGIHLNFVDNLSVTYWEKDWNPGDAPLYSLEPTPQLEKMIKDSGIPESFFSLMLRSMKPGMGVPKILTANG